MCTHMVKNTQNIQKHMIGRIEEKVLIAEGFWLFPISLAIMWKCSLAYTYVI